MNLNLVFTLVSFIFYHLYISFIFAKIIESVNSLIFNVRTGKKVIKVIDETMEKCFTKGNERIRTFSGDIKKASYSRVKSSLDNAF